MTQPGNALRVAILTFPETSASVVHGLFDLFSAAGRDWALVVEGRPGRQPLLPLLVSRDPGPLTVANGVPIHTHATLEQCTTADIICVPEIALPPGDTLSGRFEPEITWLRAHFDRGVTLAAACSGTLLLAEAGLLDGYQATTHWAWCDTLRQRYPAVSVHPERALVVSGPAQRLVMAGGGTSWLDLALYLIARSVGIEAAMQVARLNLIDWHSVGQLPFARLARTRQATDALIARAQSWIADHYRDAAPVAGMAAQAGLPDRSFIRRFRLATGMTPLEYVHTLRMEQAKELLEASADPIESIAAGVGYDDPGFFIRLFRRKAGLTPAQYRKRFGTMRKALQAPAGASGRSRVGH